jgi:hypothetical protein
MKCESEQHQTPPQAENGTNYCHHCNNHLRTGLKSVSQRWTTLAGMLDVFPENDNGNIRVKQLHPAAPLNLDAVVLRDHRTEPNGSAQPIPAIIHGLGVKVHAAAALNHTTRPTMRDVPAAITFLLTHAHRLSGIDGALAAVMACDHALAVATGESHAHPLPGIRCPTLPDDEADGDTCGGPLFPMPYTLGVRCPRCRSTWTGMDELTRLNNLLT